MSDQPQAVQDYLAANPFSYNDYVKVVRYGITSIDEITAKDIIIADQAQDILDLESIIGAQAQEILDLEAALDDCMNP